MASEDVKDATTAVGGLAAGAAANKAMDTVTKLAKVGAVSMTTGALAPIVLGGAGIYACCKSLGALGRMIKRRW